MGLLTPARSAMSSMDAKWNPFSVNTSKPARITAERRWYSFEDLTSDPVNSVSKNGRRSMALTLDLAGSLVPVTPNFREIFAITVHDV